MRRFVSDKVEIHLVRPKARVASAKSYRGSEFLILRRSPDRLTLPGAWQPVTGGIERGETAWQAAAREVGEETGLRPRRWWALEHLSIYYEPAADAYAVLPIFVAALAPGDQPRLSAEHDAYRFVSAAAARRLVAWDAQRRAIEAIEREILRADAMSHARDITHLVAGEFSLRSTSPSRRAPAPASRRRPTHRNPRGI